MTLAVRQDPLRQGGEGVGDRCKVQDVIGSRIGYRFKPEGHCKSGRARGRGTVPVEPLTNVSSEARVPTSSFVLWSDPSEGRGRPDPDEKGLR